VLRALAILCLTAGAPTTPQILFWVTDDLDAKDDVHSSLVPLGCYDPAVRQIRSGAGCITLLPQGAVVDSGAGRLRTSGRRTVSCGLGDDKLSGVGLKDQASTGDLAQYPRSTIRTPKSKKPSLPEIAPAVSLVEAKAKRKESLAWTQWSADLDGDGVDERLLAVDIGKGHDGEGARMGMLILVRAGAAVVLGSEKGARYKVLGLTDLDGDRKSELVVERLYFEGARISLERLEGDRMETIGGGAYCGS
jgi:hypothetical protein